MVCEFAKRIKDKSTTGEGSAETTFFPGLLVYTGLDMLFKAPLRGHRTAWPLHVDVFCMYDDVTVVMTCGRLH
jgi:hypothetical protein